MYSITTTGEVYSHYRNKFLSKSVNRDGYYFVNLRLDPKNRLNRKVHRLVALTYLGEPPIDKPLALHKDGNKLNCDVSNLYWGNKSDNQLDTIKHGNHWAVNKTHCPRGHLLEAPNLVKSSKGRTCLACHRAWSYNRKYPEHSIQWYADNKYYPLIMNGIS